MMGNNPTAGSFFASFIVLFCTSVALGSYFRFLAVLGGNESTANAMAGPSTGIMLIFSGLFITRSQVRNFMIWLYWISPFSWSCRALANNEFSGSRYDFIIQDINGENARAGTAYLGMIDMYVGKNWILYACIYLVALTLFLVACCSFLLRTHFYEESIGTRRINDSEIMDDDSNDGHDDNITNAELKAQVQAAAIQQAEILEHSRNQSTMESKQISTVPTSATGAISSGPGGSNTLQTLREALPFTPAWMSFSDISYTVKVPKGDQMVDRILLHNVNGYAQPGKLLALMGASGAGKTTLLDVIAGLKNTGVVQGKILINGQEATKNLIATMCGYVEQFDTLFAYSTVRETLLFAARLRLPRAVSDEIKEKIVDEILDILDLTSMANFIIGNQRIIGLSPAQCKRVNIGLELVANPSILFLDEPTTGLDSKNSMTVMKVVKRIARSGRAIICTIHQPSAELFFLFDRLLLLGAGGHQIYFGDLGHRASKFVKYLSRCPGITPIKSRVNPASWMLVELGVGVAAEKGDDAARFENATVGQDQLVIEEEPEWASLSPAQRTVQKFTKMYKLSDQRAHAMKRLEILESIQIIDPSDEVALAKHKEEVEMANLKRRKRAAVDATENEASKTLVPTTTIFIPPSRGASLFTQFSELYKRNMMAYWRNQGLIYSRAIVTAIMSLICGLVYLNVRKKIIGSDTTDLAAANSLVGAILMVSVFPAIGFLQTSLPLYFEQRVAFYREKASGFYFPTFYALCQVSIEIPWCLLNLIFGVLPSYFLLGLKPDAGAFFGTCICLVSIFLVYSSLASFLGNSCPSTAVSQPLAGAYMSLQNSLTGVSITSPNLPRAYRYSLYQIFPVQHLLRFPVLIQTKGVEVPMKYFKNGEVVDTTLSQYVSNYLGWGYDDMWHHLGWAWLYICVLQVFSALAITFISHFKR
jgi:ABC-type multidrug transport system ATPase subunit